MHPWHEPGKVHVLDELARNDPLVYCHTPRVCWNTWVQSSCTLIINWPCFILLSIIQSFFPSVKFVSLERCLVSYLILYISMVVCCNWCNLQCRTARTAHRLPDRCTVTPCRPVWASSSSWDRRPPWRPGNAAYIWTEAREQWVGRCIILKKKKKVHSRKRPTREKASDLICCHMYRCIMGLYVN